MSFRIFNITMSKPKWKSHSLIIISNNINNHFIQIVFVHTCPCLQLCMYVSSSWYHSIPSLCFHEQKGLPNFLSIIIANHNNNSNKIWDDAFKRHDYLQFESRIQLNKIICWWTLVGCKLDVDSLISLLIIKVSFEPILC